MATYFVASSGSNTAPYDTWAKAATSLQTALTAASSGSDVVVIQYDAVPSTDSALSADTTYTTANDVSIISASNDGGSAYTPTTMGTANYIGHNSLNRSIIFSGADDKIYLYGLTLRVAGSTVDNIIFGATQCQITVNSCYLWLENSATAATIRCGDNSGSSPTVTFRDCTLRFGSTSGTISCSGVAYFENCSISGSGSTPSVLLKSLVSASVYFSGCDLSLIVGTLLGDCAALTRVVLSRCKLGAGMVPLAAQTSNPHLGASGEVTILDCASGDTHGIYGYYNALGALALNTAVYYTATGASWKIDTTTNCNYFNPFIAPIFGVHHSGTSAVTPYVEILRDGSATAYQDDEVWLQIGAKTTSGSTIATLASDRCTLANKLAGTLANQAAGAGTGSWTGEGGTAWSGKIDSGSSLTPAEAGDISAQVCVGEPSITVYVDPVIRT